MVLHRRELAVWANFCREQLQQNAPFLRCRPSYTVI
jgi:hypothetical protein